LSALFNITFVRLASRLEAVTQKQLLKPVGLKVQEWRVLYCLSVSGDHHLRQLARRLSTDASHVSRILVGMEKQGLVQRSADPSDARRTRFSITPKGRDVFAQLWPVADRISAGFRALYAPEELAQLEALIARATAHAEALLGDQTDP